MGCILAPAHNRGKKGPRREKQEGLTALTLEWPAGQESGGLSGKGIASTLGGAAEANHSAPLIREEADYAS